MGEVEPVAVARQDARGAEHVAGGDPRDALGRLEGLALRVIAITSMKTTVAAEETTKAMW
jgi:hypothetical protein